MAGKVVIFVQSAGYEAAWSATSLGLTASAVGDEVCFIFGFEALRALAKGDFGKPLTRRETMEVARGEGLGVPTPTRMLAEARSMGARCYACDTMLRLCGLTPSDVARVVDEVQGLATLWRLTDGARVMNY